MYVCNAKIFWPRIKRNRVSGDLRLEKPTEKDSLKVLIVVAPRIPE
jgi:hypothetical protein